MANNFRIKKINAKEEVEFHNKGNQRDSHILSRKTMLTIRNVSWPKSKEKILTSLLTATTIKMNSKYCKTFALAFVKDEK